MNKTDLLKFIDLYNLGGYVEAVKLVSDGTSLRTSFRSDDKTLVGNIVFNDLKVEAGEYGINDTAQFRKMLSVLDEDIEIKVVKYEDKPISLAVSDKTAESLCMLAELKVIPHSLKVNEPKEYSIEIPINEIFIEKFMKATSALGDVNSTESFTLLMNEKKKKMELVIGYGTLNSNRVRLEISPVAGKDVLQQPISFSAKVFREILSKNRDTSGAYLKIDEEGMAAIKFATVQYSVNYFMMPKQIDD